MGQFEFAWQNKSEALQTQRRKRIEKGRKEGLSGFSLSGLSLPGFSLRPLRLSRFRLLLPAFETGPVPAVRGHADWLDPAVDEAAAPDLYFINEISVSE
jgi:hypothetical protein